MSGTRGVSIEDVSVRFGGMKALSDVSLVAAPGLVTGLVGPNGAGKSTLFNVITGVVKPTSGRVFIEGEAITGLPSFQVAKRRVARTFQTPRGFRSLSVLDNMLVAVDHGSEGLLGSLVGRRLPKESRELAMTLLERVGLAGQADQKYWRLSAGEARLLELARHLMRDPAYVLLDEPTAGVAPELQERLSVVLADLRSEGRTLVCVEHNMKFLRGLADHIVVLEAGKVIATGDPDTVFADDRVIAAYLGEKRRSRASG